MSSGQGDRRKGLARFLGLLSQHPSVFARRVALAELLGPPLSQRQRDAQTAASELDRQRPPAPATALTDGKEEDPRG